MTTGFDVSAITGRIALDTRKWVQGTKTVERSLERMGSKVSKFGGSISKAAGNIAKLGAAASATTLAAGAVFTSAAAQAEQYKFIISSVLKSGEAGEQVFKDMAQYAAQVPHEFKDVMLAASMFAGVLSKIEGNTKDTVKAIRDQWIPLAGDLAATYMWTISDTTAQVIRMISAGAQAADRFREKGTAAMLGFTSGVSFTAKKTREQLIQEWKKVDSFFAGSAERMGTTFKGLMSILRDKWFLFRNDFMTITGIFDYTKRVLRAINELIWDNWIGMLEWIKAHKDAIVNIVKIGIAATATTGAIIALALAFKTLAWTIGIATSPITLLIAGLYSIRAFGDEITATWAKIRTVLTASPFMSILDMLADINNAIDIILTTVMEGAIAIIGTLANLVGVIIHSFNLIGAAADYAFNSITTFNPLKRAELVATWKEDSATLIKNIKDHGANIGAAWAQFGLEVKTSLDKAMLFSGEDLLDGMGKIFTKVGKGASTIVSAWIGRLKKQLEEDFGDAFGALKVKYPIIQEFLDKIQKAFDAVNFNKPFVDTIEVTTEMQQAIDKMATSVTASYARLLTEARTSGRGWAESYKQYAETVNKALDSVLAKFKAQQALAKLGIGELIDEAQLALLETRIEQYRKKILTGWRAMALAIQGFFTSPAATKPITDGFKSMEKNVEGIIGSFLVDWQDTTKSQVDVAVQALGDIEKAYLQFAANLEAREIMGGLLDQETKEAVLKRAAELRDAMSEHIKGIAGDVKETSEEIKALGATIQSSMSTMFQNMASSTKSFKETVLDFVDDIRTAMLKMVADTIARLIMMKIVAAGAWATVRGEQMGAQGGGGWQQWISAALRVAGGAASSWGGGGTTTGFAADSDVPTPPRDRKTSNGLTIQNLIVPEDVAAAMASRAGKDVIVNVVRTSSQNRGAVHQMLRET